MYNPLKLIEDNFDDRNFTTINLKGFTEDHLVRLSKPVNNPGSIYSSLITATTTKYNAYYGKISNELTYKAIAEGTTITRNDARKAVEEKISNLQGLIKFKFGEASGVYQEFYPLGAREYQDAREVEAGPLFERFVTAATTHLTTDYSAEVTAISDLVDAFNTAFAARESAVSDVDNVGTGKEIDRKALTLQLTTNFLTIALNNIENSGKFQDYYNPFYLPLSESNNSQTEEGTITADQVLNISPEGLVFTGNTIIELLNPSATTLRYYFAADPSAAASNSLPFVDVYPNEQKNKTATELGLDPTHQFFNVQNLFNVTGTYKVIIKPE